MSVLDEKRLAPDSSENTSVEQGYTSEVVDPLEEFEVFKKTTDGVNFRTVGWVRASIIFLKGGVLKRPHCQAQLIVSLVVIFATGVLSIPISMYSLGMAF
jgi:hypothetical protein